MGGDGTKEGGGERSGVIAPTGAVAASLSQDDSTTHFIFLPYTAHSYTMTTRTPSRFVNWRGGSRGCGWGCVRHSLHVPQVDAECGCNHRIAATR